MSRSKFPRQPPATRQRNRQRCVRMLPPRGACVFDGPRRLRRGGVAGKPAPGWPSSSAVTYPRGPNMTTKLDRPDDLHAQVNVLSEVNDLLRDMLVEQRDVYESLLTAFAADGYKPAAKSLLMIREARARAQTVAREALSRVKEHA